MRPLLLALLTGLLASCAYPPLAVDENEPELGDALQEREIVVEGTSAMEFMYWSNDQWNHLCWLHADVIGWDSHADPDDVGCSGCAEAYTLVFDYRDESSCDFIVPGAANVAITQLGFFPWAEVSEYVVGRLTEYVPSAAAGPAVAYASTDWYPAGEADWSERLAVHELATGPDEGFSRAYHTRAWYLVSTSEGYASWSMDLQFLD